MGWYSEISRNLTKIPDAVAFYNDELDKIRNHEDGWREIFPELIEILDRHGIKHAY